MRDYKHLTTFPGEDKAVLDQAKDVSGLSLNQIIVKAAVEAAERIVSESKAGRVTNVAPLPREVLLKAYAGPERDEPGVNRLISKQAKGVRD